ncbi:Copper transporter 6 [Bienertia sinuspersici]
MNMHDHGMMMTPPPSSSSSSNSSMPHHGKMKMMMHMTFYWGKNAEVLFSGFPGSHTAMYILSLFGAFLLSFLVESLSRTRFVKEGSNDVASGLLLTFLHALRMGLAYLVMLAVMSFNGGIFIAAVLGHAFGFMLFGTRVFGSGHKGTGDSGLPPYRKTADLPPMSC